MTYKLPQLPYPYDALEPFIDAQPWSCIIKSTTPPT